MMQQQQKIVVDIIIKQLPDMCPDTRIQLCKCIFRFAKLYKFTLTEDDVAEISKVIVKNFNH